MTSERKSHIYLYQRNKKRFHKYMFLFKKIKII